MAVQTHHSPLGRSYSVPGSVRKGSAHSPRKSSAEATITESLAVGKASSTEHLQGTVSNDTLDVTDNASTTSRRSSVNIFSRIMAANDTTVAENVELEMERTLHKLRRDLSGMHQQDAYFTAWLGTLHKKIKDLEMVVFSHDPSLPSPIHRLYGDFEKDRPSSTPRIANHGTTVLPPSAEVQCVSVVEGIDMLDGNQAGQNHRELTTISERRSERGSTEVSPPASPSSGRSSELLEDANVRLRTDSATYSNISDDSKRRQSVSSGIHGDELLALWTSREKSMKAELGLSLSPKTKLAEEKLQRNNVNGKALQTQKCPDPPATTPVGDCIDKGLDGSGGSGLCMWNPLIRGEDISKPILIFADSSGEWNPIQTPSPVLSDPEQMPARLAERNTGIFGSVRVRKGGSRSASPADLEKSRSTPRQLLP